MKALIYFFVILSLGFSLAQANEKKSVINAIKSEDPYITVSKDENFGETATEDFADFCSHEEKKSEHLKSIYDVVLKKQVFQILSDTLDQDCVTHNPYRTRTELKQDENSPLVVTQMGESTTWSFLMKLDKGFQATDSFTHLFQAKAENLDGSKEAQPRLRMSFYNRKDIPTLEFNRSNDKGKFISVASVNASNLIGVWIRFSLKTTWSNKGQFEIVISRADNGKKYISRKMSNVDLWNDSWEFMRFKAGIYREYESVLFLKDVSARFSYFEFTKE